MQSKGGDKRPARRKCVHILEVGFPPRGRAMEYSTEKQSRKGKKKKKKRGGEGNKSRARNGEGHGSRYLIYLGASICCSLRQIVARSHKGAAKWADPRTHRRALCVEQFPFDFVSLLLYAWFSGWFSTKTYHGTCFSNFENYINGD